MIHKFIAWRERKKRRESARKFIASLPKTETPKPSKNIFDGNCYDRELDFLLFMEGSENL